MRMRRALASSRVGTNSLDLANGARRLVSRPLIHASAVCAVAALLLIEYGPSRYYGFLVVLTIIYAISSLGLDIPSGMLGQLSLGQGGAYALGAYVTGYLTVRHHWAALPALLVACVAGAVMGALMGVPAARLGLIAVGIVTLGFTLVTTDAADGFTSITGGSDGLVGVTAPLWPGGRSLSITGITILTIVLAGGTYLLHWYIRSGSYGRKCIALRDNMIGATALGINPLLYYTSGFAIGTAIGALAGGLYAYVSTVVSPDSFGVNASVLFLLMVIVGGPGTRLGPVLGVAIVGTLPLLLSAHPATSQYIYGAVLILVVRVLPRGIISRTGIALSGRGLRLSRRTVPTVEAGDEDKRTALSSRGPTAYSSVRTSGTDLECEDTLLVLDNVVKTFSGVRAVAGVSLTIRPGEIVGLVGPNGSGKTSLLNLVSGYYRPDSGSVSFLGENVGRLKVAGLARRGLARSFQVPKVFPSLRVEECLAIAYGGRPTRMTRRDVLEFAGPLLGVVGLAEKLDREVRELSHGQLRFLEVTMATMRSPKLLVLDEPAAGLSVPEMDQLAEALRAAAQAGTGVLVVEHHLEWVKELCDRLVAMSLGDILWEGPPLEIDSSDAVRGAYLGVL